MFRKKLPYDITSITYGIYPIYDKRSPLDIWEDWINSIRNNFTVLYSDKKEGIKILLMKDVFLTAKFDEETGYINLKLSTRHPDQMEYKMREDIISDLINAITSDFLEDDDE